MTSKTKKHPKLKLRKKTRDPADEFVAVARRKDFATRRFVPDRHAMVYLPGLLIDQAQECA